MTENSILLWTIFLISSGLASACSGDDDCVEVRRCVAGECVNPCLNHKCGNNQHCKAINHQPVCSYHDDNSTSECVQLVRLECNAHDHCPSEQACIGWRCLDPCLDACGENTQCQSKHHISACACKPGFFGNPFEGCKQHGVGPDGDIGQFPGIIKKYQVETAFKISWFGAYMYCLKHGRRLATIYSRAENDQAKEEIRKTKIRNARFWTSGTDHAFAKWSWMTTGQPFGEFSDWNPSEPNNGGACMQFEERGSKGYGWTDQGCKEENYFICEYYE